jgi:hypothetical protein
MAGPGSSFLEIGNKLYVTKMDVNEKKSSILLFLIQCDSCNGATDRSSLKSAVAFQFASNFLSTAEPGQVMDVINQVLAPDAPAGAQPAVAASPQPAAAPPPVQPAQPAQIQIGNSPAQVEAILGQPDTKIPLGSKLIYVYKAQSLKVTFIDQKVSDVQ